MTTRAHLLAGLRTGGPRASSPSNDAHNFGLAGGAQLKASAAPFQPGARSVSGTTNADLESQLAALQLQQAIDISADSQDFAALYGASSGQPFASHNDQTDAQYQLDAVEQLLLNNRNQVLRLQQAHQQQQQLDNLRLQAAAYQQQQQQQQQQQIAAQQFMVLAQMQADHMMRTAQQGQATVNAAQEQRQAARVNLQNSLRQRQAQQAYVQALAQQSSPSYHTELELRQQQQALMQQLQFLRQAQPQSGNGRASPASENATSWRSNSTSVLKGRTSGASDQASSWRSSSTNVSKDQASSPPCIVVDDSASELSESGTANSQAETQETPETSAEDISPAMKMAKSKTSEQESALGLVAARPTSLSAAPRSRVMSGEMKPAGSRQPRGPPTEFIAVNFASRLAARTRREAMSKLCASPRAATFNAAVTVA